MATISPGARLLLAALPALAILVVACGSGTDPTDQVDDSFTLPSSGPGGSQPGKSFGAVTTTLSGTLGFADVEGGCAYLETADGTRYDVTYPEGWTIDAAAGTLQADDGRVVSAGESLSVRGSVATDRSSICQIGPIFVATEVELVGG